MKAPYYPPRVSATFAREMSQCHNTDETHVEMKHECAIAGDPPSLTALTTACVAPQQELVCGSGLLSLPVWGLWLGDDVCTTDSVDIHRMLTDGRYDWFI